MKPREWWIETHEIMKGKINANTGKQSWPQVYETDLGHTIHVIEKSAYDRQRVTIEEARTLLADIRQFSARFAKSGMDLLAHTQLEDRIRNFIAQTEVK